MESTVRPRMERRPNPEKTEEDTESEAAMWIC